MGHVPAFTNQYKILWGFQLGRVGLISISCGVWTNVGRCRHQPGAIGLYAVRPRAVFEELKPLHQSFRSDAKEKQTWDIPQWQTKPSLFRDPMFC